MSFDLHFCLHYLIEPGGSDLHLKVPSPPRHARRRRDAPDRRPRAADAARTPSARSHEMLDDPTKLAGVRRARARSTSPTRSRASPASASTPSASAARSRSSSARSRSTIKTIDELALPPVIRELAEEERGIVLLTGTTGSGKSTTLAAMIDHINSTRRAPHRDDRGPDRVPAPATSSRSSTSARSAWTPARSSARCAASCARTRT